MFVDDKVREILSRLPSECPYIDYKVSPYKPTQKHSFLRDVIAMLNSEAAIGKEKFIIVGVSDSRHLVGIELEQWEDDNEWQNIIDHIVPRPDVRTGTVEYNNKLFGFIYISESNTEWVYEVSKTLISSKEDRASEKNITAKGQAFTRVGSRNDILTEVGRRHLLEKKIQPITQIQQGLVVHNNNVLVIAALLGSWNEKSVSDLQEAANIFGEHSSKFTDEIRKLYLNSHGVISYSNGVWRMTNHSEILIKQANKVFDTHIEIFFDILKRSFAVTDSKYDYPADKRYAAALTRKNSIHELSQFLRKGVAETLAILGNNIDAFVNCSKNKIRNLIYRFERDYFATTNWKVFASTAEYFQYLGEACPDVFLSEIIKLTSKNDNAFIQFLQEKESVITTTEYGYQLSWVIANIAKHERYFSNAMIALLQLAQIRESFLDSLVGIVLPWYPQTHASIDVRVGVFKGLAEENSELTWKALMKLMPNATTTGSPITKPHYLKVEDFPEKVSMKDYFDASVGYINIAINMIGSNVYRMCDMIQVIDDVPKDIQSKILDSISKQAQILTIQQTELLWNCVKDFTHRHRKFSDAKWSLSEERLRQVDEFAMALLPNCEHAFLIRMFRKDQYSLMEGTESLFEKEQCLKKQQTELAEQKYIAEGITGLLALCDEIENKVLLGICTAVFISDADIKHVISHSACIKDDQFLNGIISGIDFDRAKYIVGSFSDTIKAQIISKLALTDESVQYILKLDGNAQNLFWKTTEVWGFADNSIQIAEKAIRALNYVHRTDKSISIIYFCIENKKREIENSLIIDTLQLNVQVADENSHNIFYIQNIIKWLQERKIDNDAMISIEWKYLALLRSSEGFPPVYIWNELSSNPHFYIDVLRMMYGKDDSWEGTEEEKSIMKQQCFSLMFSWKQTPGVDFNGIFHADVLKQWMDVVIEQSEKYEIADIALSYFGKAAFYAPADEDGFFINKTVAKYLQNGNNEHALSGYYTESFNSRGVYSVDPTGKAEFSIEMEYRDKAKAAEACGMIRFASTLRSIADTYHEEGEEHIREHKLLSEQYSEEP